MPLTVSANFSCVWPNTTASGTFAGQPALESVAGRARVDDVLHQKFPPAEFGHFSFLIGHSKIGVAEHDRHRRDLLQLKCEVGVADVARVQDVIHAGEEVLDARIQPAMGVGDDPDFHAPASSGFSPASGSASRAPASLSAGDSAGAVSFAAVTKSAVKMPPLNSVLRKNSHVEG